MTGFNPRADHVFDKLLVAAYTVQEKRIDSIVSLAYQAQLAGQLDDVQAGRLHDAAAVRRDVFAARRRVRYAAKDGAPPRPPHERSRCRDKRRTWGMSGALPHHLRSMFTPGENAVAAVIRAEVRKHGRCTLAYSQIAKAAGLLSTTVVKRFVRQAKKANLIEVRERRVAGNRNAPNVIVIISADWRSWNNMAAVADGGGTTVPPYQNKNISKGAARGGTAQEPNRHTERQGRNGLGEGERRTGAGHAMHRGAS